MAATASAIPVLRDGTVFTTDMIAFAFEITGMTGRTERCVLGPGPGDVSTDGSAVAAVTARIPSVIARVVALRIMGEAGWCPAAGGMTHVALFSGTQVSSGLGGRAIAGAVAVATSTRTTGVMCPAAVSEGCCGMTGGAVQAGLNMGGYSIHHTYRGSAIVTRNTIVGNAGVIESRRFEDAGVMADTAILVSRDMTGFFRPGKTGIVTG